MRAPLRLVAAAAVAVLATPAMAQDQKPKHLVEYRQNVMASLGNHSAAIAKIMKRQVDYDHVMPHARAIAATADTVDDIWTKNSTYQDYKKTRALPAVWENPKDFQKKIDAFQKAADTLLKAAKTGGQRDILRAFKDLGDTCGACHDKYRYEKD